MRRVYRFGSLVSIFKIFPLNKNYENKISNVITKELSTQRYEITKHRRYLKRVRGYFQWTKNHAQCYAKVPVDFRRHQ